jgi:arabinofuranosyltransferase
MVAQVLLLAVPALVILWCGWRHRWTADDGFINLRIVRQIVDGHGPVFNVGERIETGTSPIWLAVLAALDVLTPLRLEWIAAFTGLGATAGALLFAVFGTKRALSLSGSAGLVLPLGALVYAVLPPAWDYATSGLETGVALLWIGASWWLLCRRVASAELRALRPRAYVPLVLGLAPLVRPDFLIFSVFFVLALLTMCERRHVLAVVGIAAALPVVSELARMMYFASTVPNTAVAKEASLSNWSQGWKYFYDFSGSYVLVIPLLAVLGCFLVQCFGRERAVGASFRWVSILVVVSGLVHAIYVVRVGGDFMHGRMLLPALFVVLLPASVVLVRGWQWLGVAVVAVWALVCSFSLRPSYSATTSRTGPAAALQALNPRLGIGDERQFYVRQSSMAHPVTIDDYLRHDIWARAGAATRAAAENGKRGLVIQALATPTTFLPLTTGVGAPVVASAEALGMYGYAAGTGIDVVDDHGLADNVAAHQRLLERGRPGHEKVLRDEWIIGRYAKPGVPLPASVSAREVAAARDALACGPLRAMIRATDRPLALSNLVSNIGEAVRSTGFRFAGDPVSARDELCGPRPGSVDD